MKILLLEDDSMLSEVIVEHLEYYGYSVTPVYNGLEAEEIIYKEKFDLLLLDVNVPMLNGFELLKELRESNNMTPTIFITSMNTSQNVEEGFGLGANDYLKKPFEMIELKARIENIRRHFNIGDDSILQIDNTISYNSATYTLYIGDKSQKLPKKEGDFLTYLLNSRGKVVSTDELMVNVWSYDTSPSSATIRSYIKSLRRILGEDKIKTVRGVGYIFD